MFKKLWDVVVICFILYALVMVLGYISVNHVQLPSVPGGK